MSTDADLPGDGSAPPENISLSLGADGEVWVARDEDTGVTSQGPTRQSALRNLDEAVAGYHGDGDSPTADELRDHGIDPSRNTSQSIEHSDMFE